MENVSFAKFAWNFSNLGHSVTTVSKFTSQTQTLLMASYGSAAMTATNGTMPLARLILDKIRIWNKLLKTKKTRIIDPLRKPSRMKMKTSLITVWSAGEKDSQRRKHRRNNLPRSSNCSQNGKEPPLSSNSKILSNSRKSLSSILQLMTFSCMVPSPF